MSSQPASDLLEQGRTDPIHTLRDRLPSAAPPYAEGALANPALDEGILEVLLRNPGLPGELLARIADDDRFRRSDSIKRSLVLHPATPWHVAAQFAKFLRRKQRYDPAERFQSDWYRHYRQMFTDVL